MIKIAPHSTHWVPIPWKWKCWHTEQYYLNEFLLETGLYFERFYMTYVYVFVFFLFLNNRWPGYNVMWNATIWFNFNAQVFKINILFQKKSGILIEFNCIGIYSISCYISIARTQSSLRKNEGFFKHPYFWKLKPDWRVLYGDAKVVPRLHWCKDIDWTPRRYVRSSFLHLEHLRQTSFTEYLKDYVHCSLLSSVPNLVTAFYIRSLYPSLVIARKLWNGRTLLLSLLLRVVARKI